MPKAGILHDYDLHANLEHSSVAQTCAICGVSPMRFQWSDYHGEAMCTQCGCPYQLKRGTDKQIKEDNYPYLNLNQDFIPIAKEYWNEKAKFACYGRMLGMYPGMESLLDWLKKHHPEHIEDANPK